ncbi:MAG: helix-turn-helix transcriptional regulator [Methylobacter sp.]
MQQDTLPSTGFLRLPQIIGDKKATPPVPAIIPVSKTSWWNGVRSGKYPKSYKLGNRTTVWKVEDIRALIDSMGQA